MAVFAIASPKGVVLISSSNGQKHRQVDLLRSSCMTVEAASTSMKVRKQHFVDVTQ